MVQFQPMIDSLSTQASASSASAPSASSQDEIQSLLRQGCHRLGIPLSEGQVQQFELYHQELIAWNEKFNLTAITDYREVQTKHFLDSLAGWPIIAQEIGGGALAMPSLRLVDVGTGAGFPAVPLKIIAPHLKVTLVDGTGKKIAFLRQLIEKLRIEQVEVVQGRAEELAHQPAFRARFDLVLARAVAPLSTLVEYLLPLVRIGGLAVVYKGANAAQEFIEARKAIELLGGETVRMAPLQVPLLDEKRFVLLIKKTRPTSIQYPRGQGLARKKPLG
jgi:16S rRNA (guanine527-N7)-methyltransferase